MSSNALRTVVFSSLVGFVFCMPVQTQAQEHEIKIECPTALASGMTGNAENITCIYATTASIVGEVRGEFQFKNDSDLLERVIRITWANGQAVTHLAQGKKISFKWGTGFMSTPRWREYLSPNSRVEVHNFWSKPHYDKSGTQLLKIYVPEKSAVQFWNCTELMDQQESCTIK